MGLLVRLGYAPSSSSLLVGAVLGLIAAVLTRRVRRWSRLRHIPGPSIAGWSTWWQLRSALGGRYHERLKEQADLHGETPR